MHRLAMITILLGSSALIPWPAAQAAASRGFELSIVIDGAAQAEYPDRDRTYVEAIPNRPFSLRVSNPTSQRVAVALSVDGRNVIDAARTSALAATKWILWPGQTIDIPGWQVSGETARRFFFTQTQRSYAKWLGDTSNVGLIEAVFFREKRPAPIAQPSGRVPRSSDELGAGGSAGAPGESAAGDRVAPFEAAPEARQSRPAPSAGVAESGLSRDEKDSFAATGIGERTPFSIEWVAFDEDARPAARIALRYEFRRELVKLGVFRGDENLYARDHARGFAPEYAPDPDRARAQ